ncbi:MAG: hypothetical protein QOE43_1868 [Gaiellaceae bacterium]|nr:hypothetical protein [Gaiellaceae bacterium]
MMTGDQKSRVAALKAQIAAAAGAGTPLKVRAAAVALKQELRRDGITARALAASVGVHESTLCGWERAAVTRQDPVVVTGARVATKTRSRGAGFRRVKIAAAAATNTGSVPSSLYQAPMISTRGLRVAHGPSGLVIDGLDIETLAVLLTRMSS